MTKNIETKKVGRPTKITPNVLAKLREAFLFGATKLEACAYSEIAPSTLYEYIKINPEFSDTIAEWQEYPILKAKKTIVDSLDNAKDAQWYLERKRKDEFSTKIENDIRVKELPKPILSGNTVIEIQEGDE